MSRITADIVATVFLLDEENIYSCEVLEWESSYDDEAGDVKENMHWSYPNGLIEFLIYEKYQNGIFTVKANLKVVYSCDYWGEWDSESCWRIDAVEYKPLEDETYEI